MHLTNNYNNININVYESLPTDEYTQASVNVGASETFDSSKASNNPEPGFIRNIGNQIMRFLRYSGVLGACTRRSKIFFS